MSVRGLLGATCLLPSQWLVLTVGLWAACGLAAPLTAQVINADETGAAGGAVAEASYTSSGSYFSRELGTPLRFSYQSEGYGTEEGVVSLGTMKVFNLDGATWFLDGQGTMSEDFGGGFNAGIGYRELVNMGRGFDPERILGASFWTDGQNTEGDNFFTQLGFGLESLGESFDLRMNGYFPLERTKTSDPTLIDFDTVTFSENRLFAGLEQFTVNTAFSVVDAEGAKRIGNLDAWAIAGVYHLGGGGADDTGYRVGVRGYAVPDLLVGVQVTDDDIYSTNVMATLTWFVGRTHTGNAPVGTIDDRFREPVMRNSFISTTSEQFVQGAGGPLTDADNNELFNFIHVDSAAAAGGDGSFENPFNNLAEAEAAQAEFAYVFVHGGSVLAATDPFTLLDNVNFLGEGTNQDGDVVLHAVESVERGSLFLPETSPGAQDLDSPTINVAAGINFLELADNNEVNNFEINGGLNAVTGNAINAPQLANLDINNPTGIGISLTDITGTTVIDNTVTIDGAATGLRINGGSAGMNINARITNSIGSSLIVENRTGGTIAYGGSIQDDNAVAGTAEAIIIRDNQNAVINFTQTLDLVDDLGININSGNFSALLIEDNFETTTITFADLLATAANADTVRMNGGGILTINDSDDDSSIENTGTEDAFQHEGSAAPTEDSTITVAANINNSGGGEAVEINNHTENNITFSGDITDTDSNGILLTGNTGGTIAFNGAVDVTNAGAGNGVTITAGGSDVTYQFTDIDIRLTDGIGFSATGDGTLIVTSADGDNLVQTVTGQAININGLAIGTGGAIFDEVNVSNGATEGIELTDIDGTGSLIIGGGTLAGEGGMITTAGTAISVDNVDNLVVNNVTVDNLAAAGAGLVVTGQDGGTAAFNDLTVTTSGAVAAVNVNGNTAGTTSFVDLIANSANGDAVVLNNNNGHTVNINGMVATATGAGRGFAATNQGTLSVTGDTEVNSATGTGVEINNITVAGTGAGFDEVNVSGAVNGVLLTDVEGTGLVTIGSGTTVGDGGTLVTTGFAVEIDNANNVALNNLLIDNDANTGSGISIVNQGGTISSTGVEIRTDDGDGLVIGTLADPNTDGSVTTFAGLVVNTDNGDAVTVQENTGGSYFFTDLSATTTGTGNAVNVLNNSDDSTITFNEDLTVEAMGSGNGLTATGGGTIGTSGTGTRTVQTNTGVAVNMNDVIISGGGFSLNSVNVTNGATNAMTLTDTTGGQFRVGAAVATGTPGAGGTITTVGDAIVLDGVTNAVFNDLLIDAASGTAFDINHSASVDTTITIDSLMTVPVTGENGVILTDSGTGELHFILRDSTIATSTAGNEGFLFDTNGTTGEVNITLLNNTISSTDASAVAATIDSGTGDIQFRMDDENSLNNNSAANATANFVVTASRNVNATIGSQNIDPPLGDANSFTNANGAGTAFAMSLNNGSGRINLDLRDNTATGGAVDFILTQTAGTFGVVDLTGTTVTDSNNVGTVDTAGVFINLAPPIKQPD